jgi:hypothetical protein
MIFKRFCIRCDQKFTPSSKGSRMCDVCCAKSREQTKIKLCNYWGKKIK